MSFRVFGVVPHAHFVAREVRRVDRQHPVAAVGQQTERLRQRVPREVVAQTHVDHRDAVVGQPLTAVHRVDVGGVRTLRVEVLLVEIVEVRRHEERQLTLALRILDARVGVLPQRVEKSDHRFGVGHRRRRVGLLVEDFGRRVVHDRLQEAREGVVAARRRRVAHPHRRADVFGYGLTEERCLGLFEFRARQVVHVDVGAGRDLFVDQRKVVGCREAHLGLHAAQRDVLLVFVGRGAARPAFSRVLLQDVLLSVPQLYGRRYGQVVEDAYAQFLGRGARQKGSEEDGVEFGTRVLLGVFQETHNVKG